MSESALERIYTCTFFFFLMERADGTTGITAAFRRPPLYGNGKRDPGFGHSLVYIFSLFLYIFRFPLLLWEIFMTDHGDG